jgi:hypothetical protein
MVVFGWKNSLQFASSLVFAVDLVEELLNFGWHAGEAKVAVLLVAGCFIAAAAVVEVDLGVF